jgi:hypothetical protein
MYRRCSRKNSLKETCMKHLALSNNKLKACGVTRRVEYVGGWGGAADMPCEEVMVSMPRR